MSEDSNNDYRGIAAIWLEAQEIKVWSKVNVKTKKGAFKGVLIPRGEQGDDKHIIIKLPSGYNIGISLDSIIEIKTTGEVQADYSIPNLKVKKDPKKPNWYRRNCCFKIRLQNRSSYSGIFVTGIIQRSPRIGKDLQSRNHTTFSEIE